VIQTYSTAVGTDLPAAIMKLLAYCRANNWAGYDPYDALNSVLFTKLPLLNFRLGRIALTQAFKRSPINIRPLVLIPKTHNPKALALFLSAFLKLSKTTLGSQEELIREMIGRLVVLRSPGVPYWCWGYSFRWQTRRELVAAGAPNLVCTTFAANSLLDAYEQRGEPECLNMAVSAAEYMINELYWTDGTSVANFSYPLPSLRSEVHNANFLGASLLCRVYKLTGDERFLNAALRVARYSAAQQHPDGSWYYGEGASQRWIDNFHTGYNLCALQGIRHCLRTDEFDSCIRLGFEFYRTHFFRKDGAVRYFHNRTYPIDIHCVAQAIITLVELQKFAPGCVQLAHSVLRWALADMWDDEGFFYYRVLRLGKIHTSYLRWSQAWMLLAMVTLLNESRYEGVDEDGGVLAGVATRTYG
jgi:hypothetical protein